MSKIIGLASGIAWTPEGSALFQIKTKTRKGTGCLSIIADIDEEFFNSLELALSLVKMYSTVNLLHFNITLQVPYRMAGPSAGLALFASLYSSMSKQPIRQNIAFTGALSMQGDVLPVDEIESKLEAARRAKMHRIIFPMKNLPDLPKDKDWGELVLCPVNTIHDAAIFFLS